MPHKSFHLTCGDLSVTIDAPGARYSGTRFDWTTQVRQIALGEVTFLTQENLALSSPRDQGWGLAGEFGITRPLGFHDCAEGQWFPKIGVGLLKRPDDQRYKFFRGYELAPAEFQSRQEGDAALVMTAHQPSERSYAYNLERRWTVGPGHLLLQTRLDNLGQNPIATDEYIHNFLRFGRLSVDSNWRVTLERPLDPERLEEWVDKESLLRLDKNVIGWTQTPTGDFFLSSPQPPAPLWWRLEHQGLGVQVTETAGFPVSRFHLWGRGHVVSPELYGEVSLAPGESQSWTRRWDFTSSVCESPARG